MMGGLRILLFGCPRASHDGAQWFRQETRHAEALLAYLLLNGPRPHPREMLADLFWRDVSEDRARNALSTTLWRLRKRLEPNGLERGTYLLTVPTGEVGLNWRSNLWFDVGAFETGVHDVIDRPTLPLEDDRVLARAQTALDLYEGELLEGFCDDWILRERERLRCLYFKSLVTLMRNAIAIHEWEHALSLGQRILAEDPVRESVHREVIRLHLRLGQRTQALRQYEQCVEILRTELDVDPMEETHSLREQILQGSQLSTVPPSSKETRFEDALRDLKAALNAASRAAERLTHTIRRDQS